MKSKLLLSIHLQIFQTKSYQKKAKEQHGQTKVYPPLRGENASVAEDHFKMLVVLKKQ